MEVDGVVLHNDLLADPLLGACHSPTQLPRGRQGFEDVSVYPDVA